MCYRRNRVSDSESTALSRREPFFAIAIGAGHVMTLSESFSGGLTVSSLRRGRLSGNLTPVGSFVLPGSRSSTTELVGGTVRPPQGRRPRTQTDHLGSLRYFPGDPWCIRLGPAAGGELLRRPFLPATGTLVSIRRTRFHERLNFQGNPTVAGRTRRIAFLREKRYSLCLLLLEARLLLLHYSCFTSRQLGQGGKVLV